MNAAVWEGRRVLVTGDTGFKGAWLSLWLEAEGATVTGLALEPSTSPSLYALLGRESGGDDWVDVRDAAAVAARVDAAQPEIIFHLAAQSLVRPAFSDPISTYAINVLGTVNVLEAIRGTPSVRAAVVATSDKVYEPHLKGSPHTEESPLGGADPYSSSKAGAELATAAYRRSYLDPAQIGVATARAGNVIGGGDWAADRVVPDVVRARGLGEPVRLRHPDAVRPWQHVLEPLHGYVLLAEKLLEARATVPPSLNFGPDPSGACSVAELVDRFTAAFGGKPGWETRDVSHSVPETAELRLDATLAKETLGWLPRLTLDETVRWTADWYEASAAGKDARDLALGQIAAYEALL